MTEAPALVVGAAGHRVLADVPAVRQGIESAIESLARRHPGRRLEVLSALADGADRLIAEAVLRRPGSRLSAVLPVHAEEYRTDFESAASVSEFDQFLARAERVVVMPQTDGRNEAYEAAARYIVEHCDALLAVWDGNDAQGRGGTGDTVARAREAGVPIAWVRAGNRKRGTMSPTVDAAQGHVTLEGAGGDDVPGRAPAIEPSDLPGLFQAADAASTRAQNLYLKLVAADLITMLAGAALGAISISGSPRAQELALASAIAVALGLVLTLTLQGQRLSAAWYDGRAVAEAAKTSAWRFMMRAYPYVDGADEAEAETTLISALDSFLRDRKRLAGSLPSNLAQRPQISDTMRSTRSLSVAGRKSLYVSSRLADQRMWYAARAEHNSARARGLFTAVIACHALALVAAIGVVRWPESRLNLTGVFAALAAALIAWTQLKKYEEQANVYGLTAQELKSIEEQGRHAKSGEAFSRFVEEAESAITRENAVWLARREQH